MRPVPDGLGTPVDLLVVGSGAAGLTAAVEAVQLGLSVLVVTRTGAAAGSTRWAQGGVAVPLPPAPAGGPAARGEAADDLELHVRDTLAAGAGLCDPTAVRALLADGPPAIERLVELGAGFDTGPDGDLIRTREGGHSAFRIVRAGGDATGAEVERALLEASRDARVPLLTGYTVRHLLLGDRGRIVGASCAMDLSAGATALPPGADPPPERLTVPARAVLLATGGLGALYATTTNHSVAIGDGLALALRAGAAVCDVEFVQFHPTALWAPGAAGRLPLVTEAVRGEGGLLLDARGRRFMAGVHPRAELAPRDVVARAITRVMAREGSDHVHLDATGLPGFAERFPTVTASCLAAGIDPVREAIPVVPAAHYLCGGVLCDLSGRTRVPGLFVAGEVARTGLHGANRLASNSLLEALVLGRRCVEALARELPGLPPHPGQLPADPGGSGADEAASGELSTASGDLRRAMSTDVGIGRTAHGLERALAAATPPEGRVTDPCGRTALSALAARAVITAALAREESRGCHVREDFPATDGSRPSSLVLALEDPGVDTRFTIDESDRHRPLPAMQGGTP